MRKITIAFIFIVCLNCNAQETERPVRLTYYKPGSIRSQVYVISEGKTRVLFYKEDGTLHSEVNYKDNRKNGLSIFYKDGKVISKKSYVVNILEGESE